MLILLGSPNGLGCAVKHINSNKFFAGLFIPAVHQSARVRERLTSLSVLRLYWQIRAVLSITEIVGINNVYYDMDFSFSGCHKLPSCSIFIQQLQERDHIFEF